jgi:hypothetical protein
MAELDPRDPPNENRTVTLSYLNELYAKIDRGNRIERKLRELLLSDTADIDVACTELLDLLEHPI